MNDISAWLNKVSLMCKNPDSIEDSTLMNEFELYDFLDEIIIDNFTNVHKLSLLKSTLENMLKDAEKTTKNYSRVIDDSRFGITPDDYFSSWNEECHLSELLSDVEYRIKQLSRTK